jgi:uncharacterized membrane protein
MFMFAAVYDSVVDADADYEAIKALHAGDAIGSYDSAIISRQADGKVKVTKTEKPTKHGAWIGVAAGAGAAVMFPFLLPGLSVAGMTAAGGGLGAWFGHLAHGTSRREAREMGALLDEGEAALVVVGIDHDAERIEQAVIRAKRHVLKRAVADWDDAEQEALMAMEEAEKSPA